MAAEFMREHQLIVDVISACTYDLSLEVEYKYLRPRIVDIFPRMTLSRDEGNGRASFDIMINICDSAKRLSKDDFIRFVDAISVDYPDKANDIRKKYREFSGGNELPAPMELQLPIQCHHDISRNSAPETQHVTQLPVLESGIPPTYDRPQVPQWMASNDEEVYCMDTQPRGMALIINNVHFKSFSVRNGSDADVSHLSKMFEKLKFSICCKGNLTAEQMKQECKKFAKDRNLQNVSALSVVILTHGSTNECYFGIDGFIGRDNIPVKNTYITKTELAQIFNSRNCPLMKEKPKLFIIQACRGEDENPTETKYQSLSGPIMNSDTPRSEIQEDSPTQVPNASPRADTADMCFVHSSSMGYKAYRDVTRGSPFIEDFTDLIMNKSSATDEFLHIVQKLQRAFSQKLLSNSKMTLPDFSTQLVKSWYIIPA
ncbi:caspase-14-like isoform X1 [Biomphalaria glabrata]|uniref:Caspase-14-like isoform X1 n=1 Tax=Biomphalaria glabrata TaxID=6526 RepID=A0A9W2YP56_BIOGL|nr:caspase-14-like isoform X1 [Biomphalaria glabrata]XP_055864588.1 caspase-14-like isoform X1 [Biomphalaria glabrata]XP_055864589.1 caspase-14-like isoform X1 [Biomphalaria glabrata]XP_055864590.1 caspase-14-like isoform X1 [Biomphalaria glabrata]XP_055864591.1 caspase-14-like isoform X1 [Biomphalaria glabrata]